MDWNIAKKMVIFILIVLNAVLFFFNYKGNQDYKISQAREKAVIDVLSDRNIYIYTELEYDYSPMRKINISPIYLTRDDIVNTFFKDEDAKISIEFGNNIIKSDTKTVTYKDNNLQVIYNQYDDVIKDFDYEKAEKISKDMLLKIEGNNNKYSILDVIELDYGYTFIYCEKYKGNYIYPSRYEITVNNKGVESIIAMYCNIEGYIDEKSEIYGVDEALFTFSDYIINSATVDKIEMVYDYQSKDKDGVDISSKIVPYYFIYVMEEEKPYMVNAYTNKIR